MAEKDEAIFRSAEMSLIQLFVATELSRNAVSRLGEMGSVQFRDLNEDVNTFQRSYVKEIRRLDEVERQLRYLSGIISKYELSRPISYDDDTLSVLGGAPSSSQIEEIIDLVNRSEEKIKDLDTSLSALSTKRIDMLENRHVLYQADRFLMSASNNRQQEEDQIDHRFSIDSIGDAPLLEQTSFELGTDNDHHIEGLFSINAEYIFATVSRDKIDAVEKILWRTLRGNLFMTTLPIDKQVLDAKSHKAVYKDVVVIYTHGKHLNMKAKKIIEALDGKIFDLGQNVSPEFLDESLSSINSKLTDVDAVLNETRSTLIIELNLVLQTYHYWSTTIKKEKAIYSTLNRFDFDHSRRSLIGEGWVPTDEIQAVKAAMKDITDENNSTNSNNANSMTTIVVNVLQTNKVPPTYYRTNKFTSAFQALVDAYGISSYREVNPALATIITFPFMFALMFGDIGHGIIVALIASYLILNENNIRANDDLSVMVFGGRYLILFMGLFSVYTGFCYNDIFSLSISLFNSGWSWPEEFQEGELIEAHQSGVYPFGLDPAWHGTDNGLIFMNSYKMKLSIIMGFIHMSYSLFFSLVNYRFFKSRVDIIGNFIPSVLFMQSIFGYLTLMILYKWSVDWIAIDKPAPGLLNMLINMFLSPGTVDEPLYPGQKFVQVILLLVALACVPWLLLYKPLTLKRENRKAIEQGYRDIYSLEHHQSISFLEENASEDDLIITDLSDNRGSHTDVFDFGDVMIHQVIHTIEFCLNCVSHTASYLRLWALSLAHAQLSSVLWNMTISNAFDDSKASAFTIIKAWFLFGMWFVLTVCILVLMEGTSAMLHSLRLHWVEAMSKFFEGEGYAYEPFSFAIILKERLED